MACSAGYLVNVEPDPHHAGNRYRCTSWQPNQLPNIFAMDDAINLPTQTATQWDALAHVFLEDKMWNGYDASLVDSFGAHKCGIEKFRNRMVGRGVLPTSRVIGVDYLEDGYAITNADMDDTAKTRESKYAAETSLSCVRARWNSGSKIKIGRLRRRRCTRSCVQLRLDFRKIAAICGHLVEVRPNETDEANQPFHWASIPALVSPMAKFSM